jgi:hypothetical protein
MHRSKLLMGFVTVLAVGGLGVAAFAADGGTGGTGDSSTTTTLVETSTTTTTTVAPTTTTLATPQAPSTPEDGSQGSGVARSTDGCDGGAYANHGDYVSSVAHDPSRQPGDVPAAARSDCGKPLTSVGGSTTSSTTPEEPTSVSETPPAVSPLGNGHGNAGGNGHGNGKPGR